MALISKKCRQFIWSESEDFCKQKWFSAFSASIHHQQSSELYERLVKSFKYSVSKSLDDGSNLEKAVVEFMVSYRILSFNGGISPSGIKFCMIGVSLGAYVPATPRLVMMKCFEKYAPAIILSGNKGWKCDSPFETNEDASSNSANYSKKIYHKSSINKIDEAVRKCYSIVAIETTYSSPHILNVNNNNLESKLDELTQKMERIFDTIMEKKDETHEMK
ncbi:hypothetical protein RF11_01403 [Thelohanellus kitauei]|uniref:Uncharacterized protein n=1 Tax=Thelohanellus kitauei TaxID=669202 RepID=A0A0C2JR28_THEKT|nr:hypothetical protein RF11_01403 [Thelohanellus kitauei]